MTGDLERLPGLEDPTPEQRVMQALLEPLVRAEVDRRLELVEAACWEALRVGGTVVVEPDGEAWVDPTRPTFTIEYRPAGMTDQLGDRPC